MAAQHTQAAQVDRLRAVWDPWMRAWNEQDADAVVELLVPDGLHYEDPTWPEVITDAEDVRALAQAVWRAFPDGHNTEPLGMFPARDGRDAAVVPWHMTGTFEGPLDPPGYTPTGARVELNGVDVFELRDGKIARFQTIFDGSEFGRQMGLLPPPGTRGERMGVKVQNMRAKRRGR